MRLQLTISNTVVLVSVALAACGGGGGSGGAGGQGAKSSAQVTSTLASSMVVSTTVASTTVASASQSTAATTANASASASAASSVTSGSGTTTVAASSASASTGTGGSPACSGETEPNDTVAMANPFIGSCANINPAQEFDVYSIVVAAGASVIIDTVSGPSSSCALAELDTVLELRGPDGTTVLDHNDDYSSDLCSQVSGGALAAGTYYVIVEGISQNPFDYGLSLTSFAAAQCQSEVEPNDTSGQANAATLGCHSGQIAPAGDKDLYSFVVTAPGEFTFALSDTGSGDCAADVIDPMITVLDTNGTSMLGSDDDNGPGMCPSIRQSFASAGTYYIEVKQSALASVSAPTTYPYRLLIKAN